MPEVDQPVDSTLEALVVDVLFEQCLHVACSVTEGDDVQLRATSDERKRIARKRLRKIFAIVAGHTSISKRVEGVPSASCRVSVPHQPIR